MILSTVIMFVAAVFGGIPTLANSPECLLLSRVFVGLHNGKLNNKRYGLKDTLSFMTQKLIMIERRCYSGQRQITTVCSSVVEPFPQWFIHTVIRFFYCNLYHRYLVNSYRTNVACQYLTCCRGQIYSDLHPDMGLHMLYGSVRGTACTK